MPFQEDFNVEDTRSPTRDTGIKGPVIDVWQTLDGEDKYAFVVKYGVDGFCHMDISLNLFISTHRTNGAIIYPAPRYTNVGLKAS